MINWECPSFAKVVAIGECMIERRCAAPQRVSPAFSGDTLNTLTYMARLLERDRAELFYITAVGVDADSDAMLAAWLAEGINTRFVRRFRDKLPGSYMISCALHGERDFSYDRDEAAARELFRDDYATSLLASMKGFQLLYLSGISIAILEPQYRESLLCMLKSLRRNGAIIVYDPNYRAALWTSPDEARDWAVRIYRECDVALPGFEDEKTLFNDATPKHTCDRLAVLGISEIIVKDGSSPCTVTTGGDIRRFQVTVQERAVDTTAAGDSFNAAYISARLCGNDIASSVRAGQSLANWVIQHSGAIIPRKETPRLAELVTRNPQPITEN